MEHGKGHTGKIEPVSQRKGLLPRKGPLLTDLMIISRDNGKKQTAILSWFWKHDISHSFRYLVAFALSIECDNVVNRLHYFTCILHAVCVCVHRKVCLSDRDSCTLCP